MLLFSSFLYSNQNCNLLKPSEYAASVSSNDGLIIDVRSFREYRLGHLSKSVNVNFFRKIHFENYFNKLNKKQHIYVYSNSGDRSMHAAKQLAKMGFNYIYDLKGGYSNWAL